jgi:hypothetical protein
VRQAQVKNFAPVSPRIGEVAAGVSVGELMAKGFEKALGFAEKIADTIKGFGAESLDVRGNREILQNQIKSMSNSIGNPALAGQLDEAIRNAEGRTTPRKYSELIDIGAQLISSNSKRFGSSESVTRELGQLSDLSKDEESFKLGARAITRMYAGGQVDAKHLQEFAADTGFNLSSAMMSAGGFKNKDELEHALSKKGNYHGEKPLVHCFI